MYYRKFARDFSRIAARLTNLTKKTTKYKWTEMYKEAFQELKKRLTSPLLLMLPREGEHFVVYSDASKEGSVVF